MTASEINGPSKTRLLLTAWLIVGSLDICSALIDFAIRTGNGPAPVFRFIASGLLGREALTGGTGVIILGVLLHYTIALAFTLFFYFLCSRYPALLRKPLATGPAYALFIWLFMQWVVLPLSAVPPLAPDLSRIIKGMLYLVICIGLPLAFIFRYYRKTLFPDQARAGQEHREPEAGPN